MSKWNKEVWIIVDLVEAMHLALGCDLNVLKAFVTLFRSLLCSKVTMCLKYNMHRNIFLFQYSLLDAISNWISQKFQSSSKIS